MVPLQSVVARPPSPLKKKKGGRREERRHFQPGAVLSRERQTATLTEKHHSPPPGGKKKQSSDAGWVLLGCLLAVFCFVLRRLFLCFRMFLPKVASHGVDVSVNTGSSAPALGYSSLC